MHCDHDYLNSGADACLVTWPGSGILSLFEAPADAGVMDQMAVTTSFVDNASMPALFGNMVGETGGRGQNLQGALFQGTTLPNGILHE